MSRKKIGSRAEKNNSELKEKGHEPSRAENPSARAMARASSARAHHYRFYILNVIFFTEKNFLEKDQDNNTQLEKLRSYLYVSCLVVFQLIFVATAYSHSILKFCKSKFLSASWLI